jgi:hypothetical protein
MHVGADVLQTFRLTAVSLTAGVQRSLRHRLTFSQSARAGAALRQPLRQLAGRQRLGAHTFSGCLQHNRAAPRGVSAVQSQGTRGRVVRRRQPRTDHTGAREKARDGKGAQTRAMRAAESAWADVSPPSHLAQYALTQQRPVIALRIPLPPCHGKRKARNAQLSAGRRRTQERFTSPSLQDRNPVLRLYTTVARRVGYKNAKAKRATREVAALFENRPPHWRLARQHTCASLPSSAKTV